MSELFNEAEASFETLVGEGKKYRDPDALAKAKVHADSHISNLEKELQELRTDLQARLTVEEMLERVERSQKAPTDPTREKPDTARHEPGSPKEVDLAAEVAKALKSEKEKERREANLEKTRAGLKERFGADYNQKLKEIAAQLEVSEDFLSGMAVTSPSGFFKLVDSVAKRDNDKPVVPPAPSFDPAKIKDYQGTKTAAYYRELRRTDPNTYFSRRVQNEMHREAVRQGAAFYN